MSIKQIPVKTVIRDPKNGLGEMFEEGCNYRLVTQPLQTKYEKGWEVVAECEPDNASDKIMLLIKEKKNANTSV